MNKRLCLPAVLGVLALAACAPQAPQPAGLTEEDRAAINTLRETYVQQSLAGDAAGIAQHYASNGMLMENHQPPRVGPAAIQEFYAAGPAPTALTVTSAEVDGVGDLAYDHGTYTITISPPGAPAPINDSGHYIAIFRKQADSSWKLTHLIVNSDQPLPMGGAMAGQPM